MKIWNPLLWVQLIRYYWVVSRGYRLHPWNSPYLRWRAETIWGVPAEELNASKMISLFCRDFSAVIRFACWTREMRGYLKSH
jgi:hypothetical protein